MNQGVPTLEALWRAVFPSARPHGDATTDQLARAVAWVRVLKARVPAFDALERDDLVILPAATLSSLAGLAIEPRTVVEAVARARGGGVLVVADEGSDGAMPHDVLDRAADAGLPGFLLSETDVSALERSAIAYIINGQAELERRSGALEAELERVALGGGGPAGLAATIARFLARPVAIEAADGSILAIHAPQSADAATGVASYLRRRRGASLRVPLPPVGADGGRAGEASGALVLLGAGPVTELERTATTRVAGLVALEVGRPAPVATAAGGRSGDGLPSDGPPWVALVARQLDDAAPTTVEEREAVRQRLRRLEPARRLALRGDTMSVELRLVAAVSADDPRGLRLARRVAVLAERAVAVSRPFADPAERPLMESQARSTLEAVEKLPDYERRHLCGSDGAVVAVQELAPAYRLVGSLAALPDAARQAEALLSPLLTGRPRRDRETLATLGAVLDHAGLAEAAAALGVHRNTLAYRLQGIERRTGWRLSDPVLRLALAMAVRIVQSAQDGPADGAPAGRRDFLAAR